MRVKPACLASPRKRLSHSRPPESCAAAGDKRDSGIGGRLQDLSDRHVSLKAPHVPELPCCCCCCSPRLHKSAQQCSGCLTLMTSPALLVAFRTALLSALRPKAGCCKASRAEILSPGW